MSETKVIYGRWDNYEEMVNDWKGTRWKWSEKDDPAPEGMPTKDELLFASYGGSSYDGDAILIWNRAGKLYEAQGSHCSCFGLEGQFEPEETTLAALAMRERPGTCKYGWHFMHDHDDESVKAYWSLIDSMCSNRAPA